MTKTHEGCVTFTPSYVCLKATLRSQSSTKLICGIFLFQTAFTDFRCLSSLTLGRDDIVPSPTVTPRPVSSLQRPVDSDHLKLPFSSLADESDSKDSRSSQFSSKTPRRSQENLTFRSRARASSRGSSENLSHHRKSVAHGRNQRKKQNAKRKRSVHLTVKPKGASHFRKH